MNTFGIIGLVLIQLSAISQIIKILRTKRVKDISPLFLCQVWLGLLSYLVYSLWIRDWVYIVSNLVGLIMIGTNIILYYKYRRQE